MPIFNQAGGGKVWIDEERLIKIRLNDDRETSTVVHETSDTGEIQEEQITDNFDSATAKLD